ncbi:MAG TPA: tetratricopeptide repeat protein, partial [Edaphobacter sp.]
LKPSTLRQMETPQIAVDPACTNCTTRASGKLSTDLFWGLGWGIEQTPTGKYLWHWGDNPSYKAFTIIDLTRRRALVFFANSQSGLSIAPAVVRDAIGGDHPAFSWIHYDAYDSPSLRFTLDIAHDGAKALATHSAELQDHTLPEEAIESAGFLLLYEQKKTDDAIAVFQRKVELYPSSPDANANLGEAYAVAGKKELALACYEKTLALMPTSDRARAIIERLRSEIAKEKAAH